MKQSVADAPALSPIDRRKVFEKTQEVVAYHQDEAQEGRPLYLLLGGAAVAMVSLVLLGMISYQTWYLHEHSPGTAYYGVSFLFAFYILGVFLFCYAYELYDLPKALRMTLVAAAISVVLLFVVIGSLAALAKLKAGAAALVEDDTVTNGSILHTIASFGGGADEEALAAEAQRRRGGFEPFITPGARPFLINCAGCGEVFTPLPPKAACPHCGLAAISS